jgi:nitroimidazol reductase NimA-like FMN-containing flavoprotein (pyridoxamine 5'-phosphate oxidase superfamily)
MFKAMRRADKKMTAEQVESILTVASYGVLGLTLPSGYPYAVPVNYVYKDNAIYIHCAGEGQKLDAIRHSEKATFSIVHSENVIKSKFTTAFESVMVFGTAEIIEASHENAGPLALFIEKYSQDFKTEGMAYVESAAAKTTLIKLSIEHREGKINDRKEA